MVLHVLRAIMHFYARRYAV